MPDRIIRDELLRSPRYRTLSSDTSRLLFIHLLLCVDNLGNYEANPIAISDALRRHLDDQTVSKLLLELADADLIRLYEIGHKCYLHVPRFRQRLKYLGSKHPRPPSTIECSEIKELIDKSGLQAGDRQPIGSLKAPEVKRSEVKRSEEIQKQGVPSPKVGASYPQAQQFNTVLQKMKINPNRSPMSREEQLEYVKTKTKE
jgi:hypothetical protein